MHLLPYVERDLQRLIDLTIETFGPFYEDHFRPVVGETVFKHQHGDWRDDYRKQVATLHDPSEEARRRGRERRLDRWLHRVVERRRESEGLHGDRCGAGRTSGPARRYHVVRIRHRRHERTRCGHGCCRDGRRRVPRAGESDVRTARLHALPRRRVLQGALSAHFRYIRDRVAWTDSLSTVTSPIREDRAPAPRPCAEHPAARACAGSARARSACSSSRARGGGPSG